MHKLFSDVGPRFADRPGGYSRIIRIGPRQGDAAEMVYLELVDFTSPRRVLAASSGRPEPSARERAGREPKPPQTERSRPFRAPR